MWVRSARAHDDGADARGGKGFQAGPGATREFAQRKVVTRRRLGHESSLFGKPVARSIGRGREEDYLDGRPEQPAAACARLPSKAVRMKHVSDEVEYDSAVLTTIKAYRELPWAVDVKSKTHGFEGFCESLKKAGFGAGGLRR